jgi:hemolysin III
MLETVPSQPEMAAAPVRQKPRLRGVSHQAAFFVAIAATFLLVARAETGRGRLTSLVFGVCLVLLFGISALYHRVDWSPLARARMRRLDHAAIFVLIAGGYTPLFGLVPRAGQHTALAAIWVGAAIGVAKSLAWAHAPKWITAAIAVGLGWMVIGEVLARMPVVGNASVWLLVASGAIYSLGAAVYALKRPDPLPRIFGYHEVFHALVIVASVVLYLHVGMVVRSVHG